MKHKYVIGIHIQAVPYWLLDVGCFSLFILAVCPFILGRGKNEALAHGCTVHPVVSNAHSQKQDQGGRALERSQCVCGWTHIPVRAPLFLCLFCIHCSLNFSKTLPRTIPPLNISFVVMIGLILFFVISKVIIIIFRKFGKCRRA